jgi:hypothetical protein
MAMSYDEIKDMEGRFIPENVRYLVDSMSQYSRNRFRLETVSAQTAGPGRIVTVNLPEGACLDLKSFRFHFDVQGISSGAGADEVHAILPNDAAQSLVQRVEVLFNGIACQQGASEYNTLAQIKKLTKGNQDRWSSVDSLCSGAAVNPTLPGAASSNESLVLQDWVGLLGEVSTRFIDTSIFGQCQVRLSLAPTAVLIPLQQGQQLGDAYTSVAAEGNSHNISYSVSNMSFTIDSVSLNPIYNKLLRDRLENDDYLPLNYKEYYSFSLDSITSGASTPRFSVSSGSLDCVLGTYRDSNYLTAGILPHQLGGAGGAGAGYAAWCTNYLRFRSLNTLAVGGTQLAGALRYNWSINNVQMPQYRATLMDAACDVAYAQDKVGMDAEGSLITSKDTLNDGKFVCSQVLNHPTRWGVGCKSGFNSRGINTMMSWNVSGQTMTPNDPYVPGAPTTGTGTTGIASAYVVVETTAELRAGVGKSLSVLF